MNSVIFFLVGAGLSKYILDILIMEQDFSTQIIPIIVGIVCWLIAKTILKK